MNVIHMKGYTVKDKVQIAKEHLIPDICSQLNFDESNFPMSDKNLEYIISNFTKEEGVRSLKKNLHNLYSKCNTISLMQKINYKNPKEILDSHLYLEFPMKEVSDEVIKKLASIKESKILSSSTSMMYL